jgi:lipid-A-disaccharide synthase
MRIGIVAGESSGDLLGSQLIDALLPHCPGVQFVGIAGPRMQGAGAVSWFPIEKLAVRGYVEVLRHYWEIVGIRNRLVRRLLAEPPDVFIGIDAPDFNLSVETALKKRGIPTVHYVSPSIWAWRGERLETIRAAVSKVLTLFPFEAPLYEKAGIPVAYVGHPMADEIPEIVDRPAARAQLRLGHATHLIALLPGSRQSELDYHSDLFIETAREILRALPGVHFVVPLATRETRTQFEAALYRDAASPLPVTVLFGHTDWALSAADAAVVASGTATLEAALYKCPMVITYRLSPVTYWMVKRKMYLPYAGLPNILAGEFIVPELMQEEATARNLAQAVVNLIHHEPARKKLQARFQELHRSLKQNNAERLAAAILPFLRGGEPVAGRRVALQK